MRATHLGSIFLSNIRATILNATQMEGASALLHRFAAAGAAMRLQLCTEPVRLILLFTRHRFTRNGCDWLEVFAAELEQHNSTRTLLWEFLLSCFPINDYI